MSQHTYRLLLLGLLQACAATAGAAPARTSAPAADLPPRVDLFVGDSRVLAVRPARVAVGNGRVLSVSPASANQLVLIGESPGSTVLQLWLRDGRQHRILVTVAPSDVESTLQSVQELLRGTDGISARASGTRVVLEGDAANSRSRSRAAAIAALYPGVVLDLVGKLGWEDMIHFDVRIVEFRRGRLRDLGIRWREEIAGPGAGVIADFVTNDLFRVLPPESGLPATATDSLPLRVRPAARYFGIVSTLDSRIRLLEQRGDATIVAQPTLSCRSGGAARFVAGGEIPVPVVNGVGSTDVEFREYGVILDVHPVTDTGGAIFARVETELSQVDHTQQVLGIPGLLKRRSATDINLRDGETLVLAGLSSSESSVDDTGLPGLSRIPVGGRLFGTRARRRASTELVIFLTPRVIHAVAPAAEPQPDPQGAQLSRGRSLLESARGGD
ncbi:MAG: pilus assembly protein N-terminal domain-containing protein [Steroidobacteraceae bacterium]